jgi:hypothetical protein
MPQLRGNEPILGLNKYKTNTSSSQHEVGHIITARSWYIITARGCHFITVIKLAHHHAN